MARPTIQDVLRKGFAEYRKGRRLPPYVIAAAKRMILCRTSALGGHVESCPSGHVQRVWYNSCKHRACPQCAFLEVEKWLAKQKARLLACDHYHVIFTMAEELNLWWEYNRKIFADCLFHCVRDTLLELLGDQKHLGAKPGMVTALHTWGSSLITHPHIHCLVTGGGLTDKGQWKRVRRKCLLPRKVVMIIFRGKLCDALSNALKRGQLRMPPGKRAIHLENTLKKVGRLCWNVKILERYADGQGVLTYLARYLRGGPISNRRLVSCSEKEVVFRYQDNRQVDEHGRPQTKLMRLPLEKFIGRLLQHIPLPQMQMVRSYGLYANNQSKALAVAREALGQTAVPAVDPILIRELLEEYFEHRPQRCPVCGEPLRVIRSLPSVRGSPVSSAA